MKEKLTIAETAERFNVTVTGVRYWISKGLKFEVEKVIGIKPRMIIDPDDVYEFLGIERKE
jgi:hypothetical protein